MALNGWNKGIEMFYVENLPKNCAYCDCCHTRDYDSRHQIDGEKFCGIENVNNQPDS